MVRGRTKPPKVTGIPKVADGVPEPGRQLSDDALAIYYRVGEMLRKKGLLHEMDGQLLATYAQVAALYDARMEMVKDARDLKPAMDDTKELFSRLITLGNQFGISPRSRRLMGATTEDQYKNPVSEFV